MESLSDLKIKILKLLLDNKNVSSIAEELNVSEDFVEGVVKKYKSPRRSSMEESAYQILKRIYPYYTIKEQEYIEEIGLYFDIYIPELRLAIELDGVQHYEQNDFFHGKGLKGMEKFFKGKEYDSIKDKYALNHNIYIIRIPYNIKITEDNIRSIINESMDKIKDNLLSFAEQIRP